MIDLGVFRALVQRPPVPIESSIAGLDDDSLTERIRVASHLKRFFECYCGDPDFRAALTSGRAAALAGRGLQVSSEDVDAFVAANGSSGKFEWTANLRLYRDFYLETRGGFELIGMASDSTNSRFVQWRARQMARLRFELSAASDYIVRPAVAFELSKGCSAGCWFCAISAGRLERNFDYNGGAPLWRGVLSELSSILGRAAASGFCYWATDALDNPDYEHFAADFRRILGVFPPTTTALALKNPARTRSLLDLSQRGGCRLNRFSVLTTPMLRRIHRDFSPEELALVDLVPQNPGALIFSDFPRTQPAAKILAGRVLENPGEAEKRKAASVAGTIACITGFLVNMAECSIQLVSPCMASAEFPLGYRIHGERVFRTAEEFGLAIEGLIDSHMPASLPSSVPLHLRADLGFTPLRDGFRLWSVMHSVEFRGHDDTETGLLRGIGEIIRDQSRTVSEVEETIGGASPESIRQLLERIDQSGVFDDSPPRREEMPIAISQAVAAAQPALTEGRRA